MNQSARQILVRTINTPEVKQRPLKPNRPTGIVDEINPYTKTMPFSRFQRKLFKQKRFDFNNFQGTFFFSLSVSLHHRT